MPLLLDHIPTPLDVTSELTRMGLGAPDIAALDVQSALDAVESEVSELCGGAFLVSPDEPPTTLKYNAPDARTLVFRAPLVSSPDAALIQVSLTQRNGCWDDATSDVTTELLEGVDYSLWPETAPQKSLPYSGLLFEHGLHRVAPRGISVSGVVGFGTRLNKRAFDALLGGAIWKLYPVISARLKAANLAQNGAVKSKTIGALREDYLLLTDGQIAAFKVEAPLLGARFDDFVNLLRSNKPLTA